MWLTSSLESTFLRFGDGDPDSLRFVADLSRALSFAGDEDFPETWFSFLEQNKSSDVTEELRKNSDSRNIELIEQTDSQNRRSSHLW